MGVKTRSMLRHAARALTPSSSSSLEGDGGGHVAKKPKKEPPEGACTSSFEDAIDNCNDQDAPLSGPVVIVEAEARPRGKKKFEADLARMQRACESWFEVGDLRVGGLRVGSEEGAMEFTILDPDREPIVALTLMLSESTDYPDRHHYLFFSSDPNPPAHVIEAVESGASCKGRDVRGVLERLLMSVSKAMRADGRHSEEDEVMVDEDEDADGSEEEMYADDLDEMDRFGGKEDGFGGFQMLELQRDFVEIVGLGYRPGLIRFSHDMCALSIAIPIVSLTKDIPPRALAAWDRRLLQSQHLTLLISGLWKRYPVLHPDGTPVDDLLSSGVKLSFNVGLTKNYKPGAEQAAAVGRNFGMGKRNTEAPKANKDRWLGTDEQAEKEREQLGDFHSFNLSESLDGVLNQGLLKLVHYRRKFALGWAGAETLLTESERSQKTPEIVMSYHRKEIVTSDAKEKELAKTYKLPHDPLAGSETTGHINFPLTAFCYLLRRLTLCPRYCLVCHGEVKFEYPVLKPYVCSSNLCAYQYYMLGRGPSLEYEIRHNPTIVDLLVSLAYCAAAGSVLDVPLPTGLGLRVPIPDPKLRVSKSLHGHLPDTSSDKLEPGPDGLCDFDQMNITEMRATITNLINALPSVNDMKKHLDRKIQVGMQKPKLTEMDPMIPSAAWPILRWCVGSCTAHLEELTQEEDRIGNIDRSWRQFRFTVGAPNAEAKFKEGVAQAQREYVRALKYPSLYAFHGSPLRNWHSIIRHGLWYKTIEHGRSYGDGVYMVRNAATSMSGYTGHCASTWRNSLISPKACVALAEIVNNPSKFVSTAPYFVVAQTSWIMCRYLLVSYPSAQLPRPFSNTLPVQPERTTNVPIVPFDFDYPTSMDHSGTQQIEIPQFDHGLTVLLDQLSADIKEVELDADDLAVFGATANVQSDLSRSSPCVPKDDWKHDPTWVQKCVGHLMPPPTESMPRATMALRQELRAMLSEQQKAGSLRELGWYLPEQFIGDNLFQWIVELHSFEEGLPVARDMKAKDVNSLVFEIRFPGTFPDLPPFFRILKPRFLPFINGGGGHITGGGSMCMDLLTTSGWLPSYSISAILLQIRLAISNLDPRPARLASNWDHGYGIREALEGYKRAATAHGWKVPPGIDKLAL